jgi:hypothetical protein
VVSKNEFVENLQKDPAKLKAVLRAVIGAPSRTLEGKEYDNTWIMLLLIDPDSTSNNQHTLTEVYTMNRKTYHVTYGLEDCPVIEEILEDDIQ